MYHPQAIQDVNEIFFITTHLDKFSITSIYTKITKKKNRETFKLAKIICSNASGIRGAHVRSSEEVLVGGLKFLFQSIKSILKKMVYKVLKLCALVMSEK